MASAVVNAPSASPASTKASTGKDNTVSSSSGGAIATSSSGTGQNAKSALARSLTGTLAFYFKRPVRLFRPTRISAWTAFTEMSAAQGHGGVNAGFLRTLISKQGWSFFFREAFPPLLANSLVGFTLFTTYTVTEAALKYFPSEPISPYYIPFLSGATAGAAQSLISSPLDNVRSVLAARANKPETVEWKGWRNIGVQALFPKWLTTTISFKESPIRFTLSWFKSTWTLFQFTLLRDSLGFACFFSVFELSRSLAKRAGKAVDRFQANIKRGSERFGINLDIDSMLENDMVPRGWTGRVVQALVIMLTGVLAGIGYGVVGRPFDKARTVVWDGLEEWSRRTKHQAHMAKEAEVAVKAASLTLKATDSIKANPKQPKTPTKPVSALSHRDKHARLNLHEHRLPIHPPRPAQPPKHPLVEPSIMYDYEGTSKVPSASSLLLSAYRREGALAMLGYSKAPKKTAEGSSSVLSRSQLTKSKERAKSKAKAAPTGLESLAEHPALGGTSVFDNLPPPTNDDLLVREKQLQQAASHRKPRLWAKARSRRKMMQEATGAQMRRWARGLTVANIFRVIPPYCYGFLVYATLAGDLNE